MEGYKTQIWSFGSIVLIAACGDSMYAYKSFSRKSEKDISRHTSREVTYQQRSRIPAIEVAYQEGKKYSEVEVTPGRQQTLLVDIPRGG